MVSVAHPVHAALVLVDVGHEPVTEHTPLSLAQVDTADMAGEVSRHDGHIAVGTGGRDPGVDSGHVIIQPRHPEAALRTLRLVTLVRDKDVTLQRGRGLELFRTLGALVHDWGLLARLLLLFVADGLMPFQ